MAEMTITVNGDRIVHETIDGEVVLIDLETGAYYNLIGVGADIWAGIVQNASRRQLIAVLASRYATDVETMAAAVDALVDEMVAEEIVAEEIVAEVASDSESPLSLDGASDLPFSPPILQKYTNMSDLLLLDPIHDVDEQGWPHRK